MSFSSFYSARTEEDHAAFESELREFVSAPDEPYAAIITRIQSSHPELTSRKIIHLALNLHASVVEIAGNGFAAMGKSYVDRAKEGLELIEPLLSLVSVGLHTSSNVESGAFA
jgi:hypothetical protein